MPDCSDAEFAQRCADDLPGYRDRFVARYYKTVCKVVTAVLRRQSNGRRVPWGAEDLTQEVFASLLEKQGARLRTFEGQNGCCLATWLCTVAARRASNMLRDSLQTLELPDGRAESQIACQAKTQEEWILENEAFAVLRAAIQVLPDKDRLIFRLIYEDAVGYAEAARACQMSTGALYTRASRIREQLRDALRQNNLL